MAIDKGNIRTSANYDVKAQKPLDGRAVRPAKGDLIKKESWSSDGSTVYVYEGMQVYVQDEKKTYYLKDLSKMFATDFSGWELMGTGAAAEVEVDDAISLTSENPVQNKVITDALDGLVYDYDLLSVTLEQMEAIFNIITSNPMKSKSITCRWGNGMAKVELVYAEGVQGLIAYVGAKKYLFAALGGTNGWCEVPWVFTPDGNNWLPMLGMANMSSLCNEARIEINGKLHPVVYYEGNASDATLYAVVEDKLNKYVVHGELLANPALMTLESSTPIGGGGVSEDGTLLLPIYAAQLQANVPLTSEEIEANKIAYRAAREGIKALYYIHTVQLGDIKILMTGTLVGTGMVMFQSSLGVATSSDPNSDICDTTIYAVMIASDGQSQGIDLSRNLATKEYVDAHIGGGNSGGGGGGSASVDTELSLTSNNPVSNAEISKNIGVRVVEADIATKDGFNQVIEVLAGKGESLGAIIPVLCLLNGQLVFVKGMGAFGGLAYLLADGLKRYFVTESTYCEYPFIVSDSEDKWGNNEIAIFFYLLLNDNFPNAFNDAIIELGGMRYPINSIESKSGYVEIKTTIGNEVRTYKLALTVDYGDLGVPTLIGTEYIGSGGGGGSTSEPELRPLYVPNLNAGSTLTDEQIAYNEETCQKMLNGAAMAVVTDGTISSYSDNIIDLTPQGAEGYVVYFKGVGGVYVIGGDVMVTLPDVSTSAIIPEDIAAENAADITNLVIAISLAASLGFFPACYLEKGDIRRLFQNCGEAMGVVILNIEYYDGSTRVASTYLLAGDGSGGVATSFRYPTKIYLAPSYTEKDGNVDWMKTRHNIPREVPTLKYGGIEYYPISINRYSSDTGYADFTIYRDGAFETWRMMDDGSTTKL